MRSVSREDGMSKVLALDGPKLNLRDRASDSMAIVVLARCAIER